jgi:hypothetical protein
MASIESHPGVYVYEVKQTAQPIVGASTSTAAFIGWVRDDALKYTPVFDRKILRKVKLAATAPSGGTGTLWLKYPLSKAPAALSEPYAVLGFINKLQIQIGPYIIPQFEIRGRTFGPYTLGGYDFPVNPHARVLTAAEPSIPLLDETLDGWRVILTLVSKLVNETDPQGSFLMVGLQITVEKAAPQSSPDPAPAPADLSSIREEIQAWIAAHPQAAAALKALIEKALGVVEHTVEAILAFLLDGISITVVGPAAGVDVFYYQDHPDAPPLPRVDEVVLCTSYDDYCRRFTGNDSSGLPLTGLFELSNAVYGFFDNGGSICYVIRTATPDGVQQALATLDPYDDISLVAAPMPNELGRGSPEKNRSMRSQIRQWLWESCQGLGNRFAILDGEQHPKELTPAGIYPNPDGNDAGANSNFAAIYYPWIRVGTDAIAVPPCGHIAGIYARTDATRGVFKAPANVAVLGAVGLTDEVSRDRQNLLNPAGINCIRRLNGSNLVWGARTVGGDANGTYKYISSRRMMIYIEQSIRESTRWAVFEPNSPPLWAQLTRSVSDFLYNTWRDGGLFGRTQEEAYFVRCDASTNPASQRELGQVHALVGVALIQPAEFVIFDLYQFAA